MIHQGGSQQDSSTLVHLYTTSKNRHHVIDHRVVLPLRETLEAVSRTLYNFAETNKQLLLEVILRETHL